MSKQDLTIPLMNLVPLDGRGVGNTALRQKLTENLGRDIDEAEYAATRDALVAAGRLVKGQGRGGSVRRPGAAPVVPGLAEVPSIETIPAARAPRKPKAEPPVPVTEEVPIRSYRHTDRRANNPEVGLVKPENDPDQPRTEWAYDPHLDPELRFDMGRSQVEGVIDQALESEDPFVLREALQELKRLQAPYLNWTGKAERTSFEVDTVSLHVHERIDPASILAAVRKGQKATAAQKEVEYIQPNLFEAPWEQVPLREAIDFYRHDRGWANRLIAGDSLLVMNSLLHKEAMAGQVQMIYIDPPYGIKYGSNFQPFTNKRDVKDRKDEDLTQEPEMIKAFRDTWELGVHSYLTYLRDRLILAKDLLHESGSVFVQISDENLHHVREVMDEVLGASNFVSLITFVKTSGQTAELLSGVADYILWYAKDRNLAKYHQLYRERSDRTLDNAYTWIQEDTKQPRKMNAREIEQGDVEGRRLMSASLFSQGFRQFTSVPYIYSGVIFDPGHDKNWKTTLDGIDRLGRSGRLLIAGSTLCYKRFAEDFSVVANNNLWEDTVVSTFVAAKLYVVQTATKVIERCIQMTTDPGDLVLDPTCGSGTTALVAEKCGRRWITCDTSRVATTLAKARLMTAGFDYYSLKYPHEGLKGGFVYNTVPHITLKSISSNPDIDSIYNLQHPKIESALQVLNNSLRDQSIKPFTVTEGTRKGQRVDFEAPESKTVKLPSGEFAPAGALLEWEVPFELPDGWPEASFDAFNRARQAMQKAMDSSIAAHADQEQLFDQPQVDRSKRRITGLVDVNYISPPATITIHHTINWCPRGWPKLRP